MSGSKGTQPIFNINRFNFMVTDATNLEVVKLCVSTAYYSFVIVSSFQSQRMEGNDTQRG